MIFDRSKKPEPSEQISFHLPEIERFTLDNNLQVLFVQKSNLPILQINLILNAGSKHDPSNKKGLTNLFGMMIDEGAGEYNAIQLSEEFDTLGTVFGISSDQDSIYFSLQTLKENFDKSLQLFSTVLTKPHFIETDFAREQRKVLTRLLQLNDDTDEIANMVFERIVYDKETPYAYPVIGYTETIKNITVQDIKAFYKEYFYPNNSSLIVVGDISKTELSEKLNTSLAEWKPERKKLPPVFINREIKPKFYFVNKEDSVQSEIRIGHLTGSRNDADYFSKLLLNTILGGQFASRINLNLREDKGYTYGAHSRFSYFKESGYFYVATSVEISNTADAIKEILYELRNIQNGVSEEELQFAKFSISRKFPAGFETNPQIASNLSSLAVYSLRDNYFQTYLQNLERVTLEEVNKNAIDKIFPDKTIIVVVGDKEKLSSELVKLNLGDFTEADIYGNDIIT